MKNNEELAYTHHGDFTVNAREITPDVESAITDAIIDAIIEAGG